MTCKVILKQLTHLGEKFETWTNDSIISFKPYLAKAQKEQKTFEDSLYIEDELNIDEQPSFKLPKNLTVSGTGKKIRD